MTVEGENLKMALSGQGFGWNEGAELARE